MNENYLGMIVKIPYHYPIRGWMPCHGQPLAVRFYTALYTLMGTRFGGQHDVTFNLPDLRVKRADGSHYELGEIMEDGQPYIDSWICVEGLFPSQ